MSAAGRLVVVDDDAIFAETLARALARHGYAVRIAGSLDAARALIAAEPPDGLVIDLRIGTETGLALVEELAGQSPPPRMVILTGYGSIATAVEAIKLGAVQYLTKPATAGEILAALAGEGRTPDPADARPLSVRRLEWEHIQKVLAEHDGNVSATARALGMHRRTLQRKLQKRPVRE